MNIINENASFNTRILQLREAHLAGDSSTVRFLIDNFKAKRDYYDTVTVESLNSQAEETFKTMKSAKGLTAEERDYFNNELARLRNEIVEKKAFEENKELVNEICSENLYDLLDEKSSRIIRKRRLTTIAAVVAGVVLLALGAKGCSKKNVKVDTTTTTTTISMTNGDNTETMSTTESSFEETAPIEYFELDPEYSIDPVLGTPTTGNGNYTGSTNGTTNGTTGQTVTGSTATPTPTIIIPGVDNTTNVVITRNPDGSISELTWETVETTINAPIVDTDPTGNDPLPIEPSHVVNPDPTDTDRPAVITITPAPVPVITPTVPTGDVPGEQPTVYPTEPNVPVPTNATEPSAPTAGPTDPTSAPTLPEIPTWDIEGEDVIEYDMEGHVVSNTMTLRR